MEFRCDSPLDAYLAPAPLVDSDSPAIAAFVEEHLRGCQSDEAARRVFHFVRDDVRERLPGARLNRSVRWAFGTVE